MLAALEGHAPADFRHADVEGRRFAVLRNVALEEVRDAPMDAFKAALDRLSGAGATIEEIDIAAVDQAMPLSGCLYTTEAYGLWRDVIEANPDAMYSEILERFRLGKAHSGADYIAAWDQLSRLRSDYHGATAGYDAVLLPTAPILPPNLARLESDHDYYVSENLLALRNTRIGNLMGACALTVPTGTGSCGLMMMCPPNMEERLLRLGAGVEEALQ